MSFSVLFVCICVLHYCHRVATQLQLNISYHMSYQCNHSRRQRVWSPVGRKKKVKFWAHPTARVDRLKIFTIKSKDCDLHRGLGVWSEGTVVYSRQITRPPIDTKTYTTQSGPWPSSRPSGPGNLYRLPPQPSRR